MCPSLPGHGRGAPLHPRPRAPAPGDDGRRAGGRGLAVDGRAGRARPVPVLQGLRLRLPDRAWTWPPTSPSSCDHHYRRPAAAAVALLAGLAAGVAAPRAADAGRRRIALANARHGVRARAAAFAAGRRDQPRSGGSRRSRGRRSSSDGGRGPRPVATAARPPRPQGRVVLWPDTFTTTSRRRWGMRGPAGAGARRASSRWCPSSPVCCGLTWTDDRPAGRARGGAAPDACGAGAGRRGADRGPGAVLRGLAAPRPRGAAAATTSAAPSVARRVRTLAELLDEAGWVAARRRADRARSSSRTATSRRSWAPRRTHA